MGNPGENVFDVEIDMGEENKGTGIKATLAVIRFAESESSSKLHNDIFLLEETSQLPNSGGWGGHGRSASAERLFEMRLVRMPLLLYNYQR